MSGEKNAWKFNGKTFFLRGLNACEMADELKIVDELKMAARREGSTYEGSESSVELLDKHRVKFSPFPQQEPPPPNSPPGGHSDSHGIHTQQ